MSRVVRGVARVAAQGRSAGRGVVAASLSTSSAASLSPMMQALNPTYSSQTHPSTRLNLPSEVDVDRMRFQKPQITRRRGLGIVHSPLANKGTGFSMAERDRLRIRGLVPPRQLAIEAQEEKMLMSFRARKTDIEKHEFLTALQDRNETLFFRCLIRHIEEMAPVVYTPTVGVVCQKFGSHFRRSRGMYFASQDRGQMATMVYNWPHDDVQVIVVTDGSRILGLGDLGANGMGIPIGKLALYVAAGGINPSKVLPIMLDCGTNNKALLADPYYLGMQHPRLDGHEYYSLVHELLESVTFRWPNALVQFEDFETKHAHNILDAYRNRFLCFNDDIQGTGAVTLAGLLCAIRTQGVDAKLSDQRIVVVGAGSAGIGVSKSIVEGMVHEGLTHEEALARIWIVDDLGSFGTQTRGRPITPQQQPFARKDEPGNEPLPELIRRVKPSILLGLTGVGGTFKEPIIREMAKHHERPIIFPLSNPTSSAECTAEQAYAWTDGRAVFASGSPFDPVEFRGKTLRPSQCNNMFIFPGVGLGASLVVSKSVTDGMFLAAAKALAASVTEDELDEGMVFPRVRNIRNVSCKVAAAVAREALADGIARVMPPAGALEDVFRDAMYEPEYVPLLNDVY